MVEVVFSKRSLTAMEINLEEFISVKGIKALGNQLTTEKIKQVNPLASLPYEEPKEIIAEEVEVIEEEIIEEKLPLEVPIAPIKPKAIVISSEEKAKIALQKTIEKKKNENKEKDDDSQTTLF